MTRNEMAGNWYCCFIKGGERVWDRYNNGLLSALLREYEAGVIEDLIVFDGNKAINPEELNVELNMEELL